MKEIYIFDLDGTLVDSMRPAVNKVLEVLDDYGIPYSDDLVQIFPPLGYHGLSVFYAEKLGVPLPAEEIYAIFEERLSVAYAHEIPLKAGVKECLETLSARGARLNILTASPHKFIDPCLKNHGVTHLFENVWSSEDFGLLKSDTRIFSAVAQRLNVDLADCTMVDDNLKVLTTAKKAGVKTIGVYDEMSADNESEIRALADMYVYKLTEML